MKTIWYNCYVDAMTGNGVSGAFVEENDIITPIVYFKQDSTINELLLVAILSGLSFTQEGDVQIYGCSRYGSDCLHRLRSWIDQGEVETKTYPFLLEKIWEKMINHDSVKSQYFQSRRADPMLWTISQATGEYFRYFQLLAIDKLKYPAHQHEILYPVPKAEFLTKIYLKPLTELRFESEIIKQRKRLSKREQDSHVPNNVIRLPLKGVL